MPLIVEDILRSGFVVRSDVSPVYIIVSAKYLSRQYLLQPLQTYWVEGTILAVEKATGALSEEEKAVFEKHVFNKEVRLLLVPGPLIGYDSLYFDLNSWALLRDAGIFPGDYKVKIKLLRMATGEKTLDLYPYRNIATATPP